LNQRALCNSKLKKKKYQKFEFTYFLGSYVRNADSSYRLNLWVFLTSNHIESNM